MFIRTKLFLFRKTISREVKLIWILQQIRHKTGRSIELSEKNNKQIYIYIHDYTKNNSNDNILDVCFMVILNGGGLST